MQNSKHIFDSVAVPLVEVDSSFRAISLNKPAQEVLGEVHLGTKVSAYFSKKKKLEGLLQEVLKTGAARSLNISSLHEFSTDFKMTAKAVPRGTDVENFTLILTFEDRTPSQDAKSMRSDFVANVSHEIRSPLTAISGFVETLQGAAKDDPDARELFLGLMGHEVERMTNLVRDLLSLSHVEVKERRAPRKLVDPNQVITQASETASAFAQKHGKTLALTCENPLPQVFGNQEDLVRVLINLVENAVNYGEDGSEVRLDARLDARNGTLGTNAVIISVKDVGEGIPAAEIPRLTQRFYRIDKSRSRDAGGTGLGLAIVKHILKRHRGKLEIESVLGQGSEFRILLPVPT